MIAFCSRPDNLFLSFLFAYYYDKLFHLFYAFFNHDLHFCSFLFSPFSVCPFFKSRHSTFKCPFMCVVHLFNINPYVRRFKLFSHFVKVIYTNWSTPRFCTWFATKVFVHWFYILKYFSQTQPNNSESDDSLFTQGSIWKLFSVSSHINAGEGRKWNADHHIPFIRVLFLKKEVGERRGQWSKNLNEKKVLIYNMQKI